MRHRTYPPAHTHMQTGRYARCVVEMTPEDIARAVCMYAASRDEYLPYGRVTVKPGKADGVTILEILFDPEEQ